MMPRRESGRGVVKLRRMPRRESGRVSSEAVAVTKMTKMPRRESGLPLERMPRIESGRWGIEEINELSLETAVKDSNAKLENTSSKNVAVKEVNGVFTQSPHEFTSGPFGTLSANLQSSDDDSEARQRLHCMRLGSAIRGSFHGVVDY